jgi:hypothetical protein
MTEQNDAATMAELQKSHQEAVVKLLPGSERLFFDAVVHLAVGPFVSKISFGNQSPADNSLMSVTTITVPTSVLTDLAFNIVKGLANPGTVEQLAAGQAAFMQAASKFQHEEPDTK